MTPEQTRQLLLDVLSTHTAEINGKFAEINGKFNVINEILERIEVQTTKTNGRVNKYNQFTSNLDLLTEIFLNGDQLVKKGNELLTAVKAEIDSGEPTAWTKQDFNDMLAMRNAVLAPIMENASFAMQFTPYTLE